MYLPVQIDECVGVGWEWEGIHLKFYSKGIPSYLLHDNLLFLFLKYIWEIFPSAYVEAPRVSKLSLLNQSMFSS